ncbi:MAG: winged helix-turn-helix domain-containing protein [Thermoplasmata archaeon]|uniref:Winged helix-turn-helix domain-containing protein n=1 Tax=Candidatus Sysuiplasma superficiale TaxID=2823368 RepID=A0A8J7YTE6_9ARCH|nr:winged helix-turn-helix transcriptional regulator [Candidatus Sysuiplasma superficiale]MBX8644303.1 winged helix-turn-helix domain-containing protein [Candidatus Sysuiplasma superficiale]MCL4346464.1 winged helix-turn-helix domain-containing protein [Candidatus Thermoplasmatota archaeon]MCL5437133.1 winged helix-turn-helix domain-containing protein [Candidatus Thermoplasmatota archaeon]
MTPFIYSQLLTDEYAARILTAVMKVPRSAQQLSASYGIPIAACYRRIRLLEKYGLIECRERRLSQQGKRISYYISTVKNAYIFFEGGRLRVRLDLVSGATREFEDKSDESGV